MIGGSRMYLKLSRKHNGGPVWVNADHVTAVLPGHGGGAVVIPAGDDIDYDVTESPEDIMSLLGCEVKSSSPAEQRTPYRRRIRIRRPVSSKM